MELGRRLRRTTNAFVFVLSTSVCFTAFGQAPATPAPSTERMHDASQRFAAGNEAFLRGDFRGAGVEFDAAYLLVPHQDALWNAAQAWESAGELARAANRYDRYLSFSSTTAPGRAQATQALAKLGRKLGRIHILGLNGEGAAVDGESIQADVVYVYPGMHRVTIQRDGAAVAHEVTVAAQEDRSVSFGAPSPTALEECVAAAEAGQKMRESGKVTTALERFRVCSAPRCPQVVARDCSRWLEEINERIPTLLFDVRASNGRELRDVRVFVDGTMLTSTLDGKAIPIDPGPHVLRFEAADSAPAQLDVMVKEGEKLRRLKIELASVTPKAEMLHASPDGNPAVAPPNRTPIIVLGGIGIAGIATFGVLGAMGQSTKNELASTCAPHGTCNDEDVSGVHTKLLVADVALGVGVVALAVGVYLFVRELGAPAHVRR